MKRAAAEPVARERAPLVKRAATVAVEREVPRGWVWIEPGRFWMGSPEGELGRDEDEALHEVALSRGFFACVHPVTQEEWDAVRTAVMGTKPSRFQGGRRPVERVSWYDAVHYCNARSKAEGLPAYYRCDGEEVSIPARFGGGYRLPTEAEWEYMCRAGTRTATYNGDLTHVERGRGDRVLEEIAWYAVNAGGETKEVCQREPNAWGLHDLLGNVWEWCFDAFEGDSASHPVDLSSRPGSGTFRVLRGGCWRSSDPSSLRAAYRGQQSRWEDGCDLGFRCVKYP